MAHYDPRISPHYACDGAKCPFYEVNDDGQPCCNYLIGLYGKSFRTDTIDCPKKL